MIHGAAARFPMRLTRFIPAGGARWLILRDNHALSRFRCFVLFISGADISLLKYVIILNRLFKKMLRSINSHTSTILKNDFV